MSSGYFITGTGTGIGKTFISSVLCEAIGADYWKPVQCGDVNNSDSDYVKRSSGGKVRVLPERYLLQAPQSPHHAAAMENVRMKLSDFQLPVLENKVIVEGAGGILVPLNNEGDYIIDLAAHLELPLILVAGYYLGAINHTLLSLEYLINNNMAPAKVFLNNGWPGFAVEAVNKKFPGIQKIRIPFHQPDDAGFRNEQITIIRQKFQENIK